MNIGFSYRPFGASLKGFDDLVKTRRHSFMLESYKYLFNWLGFATYAGIAASVEKMQTHVNGRRYEETKFTPGLIIGWDIRVTKTGTGLLRTNLCWSPGLHMEIDEQKMMFDQLEFNFIQWVHFIGRSKIYRKYSKTTD